MHSGNPLTPHDLKEQIKRLLKETLREAHRRTFYSFNTLKKCHYAEISQDADPIDNSENLNHLINNNDVDLIKHIIAEIIIEDKSNKLKTRFDERISDYNALCIFNAALQLVPEKRKQRERYLLQRLHLIAKDKLIEHPKNNLELVCNILINLKHNKDKIAHTGIRKYVDTVDNERKQECIKSAIRAIEQLMMGEINPKRLITALHKLNLSKATNSQLSAQSYFSKPGKTEHVLSECYDALIAILNSLRAEEFKSYISPSANVMIVSFFATLSWLLQLHLHPLMQLAGF